MFSLQSLRQSRALIRWMLACFVLAVGVAVAAPVVNPQALSLVCSAGGSVKLVAADAADSGAPAAMAHTLDCVMCLPVGVPPASADALVLSVAVTDVLRTGPPRQIIWRTADPASARAPPARV